MSHYLYISFRDKSANVFTTVTRAADLPLRNVTASTVYNIITGTTYNEEILKKRHPYYRWSEQEITRKPPVSAENLERIRVLCSASLNRSLKRRRLQLGLPRSTVYYVKPRYYTSGLFLWGHVKNLVYAEKVRDIDNVRHRITGAAASIIRDMLANMSVPGG